MTSAFPSRYADNREVNIPDLGTEVTLYFYNADGDTRNNDTATAKYFNVNKPAQRYRLTADQAFQILEYEGTVLTDPLNVAANANAAESELGAINRIKIKTTVANTTIKCFIRGAA